MDIIKRIETCGIVPVVVIDDPEKAVPAAKALLSGGIDVMEITLRTGAAEAAIKAVASSIPEMLVGAGTVLNLEQTRQALEAGAGFIVSPGFDQDQAQWCVNNGIPLTPGCATPSEIMRAVSLGLRNIKFFPANVYGGLSALKALAGPFGDVKFIPTGGIDQNNLGDFAAAPFVLAAGGSWVCPKDALEQGDFSRITELCRASVKALHGFEFAHLGINTEDQAAAKTVAERFSDAFMLGIKEGESSVFAGPGIEVVKSIYYGANGHIAVKTNHVERAAAHLEKKGFIINRDSIKIKNDRIIAVYLRDEVAGFAVHLLQK